MRHLNLYVFIKFDFLKAFIRLMQTTSKPWAVGNLKNWRVFRLSRLGSKVG